MKLSVWLGNLFSLVVSSRSRQRLVAVHGAQSRLSEDPTQANQKNPSRNETPRGVHTSRRQRFSLVTTSPARTIAYVNNERVGERLGTW